jgi:flagellar motor switch protein FliM
METKAKDIKATSTVNVSGRSDRPREKITSYDFKRPERVGKEQMRALQSLHEGFGRNFGAALSALLRSIVEVKLTSVDQLTYSEFVFSLENPTCFNLLKAEPLDGNLILDINPSILYPIIDRLLGGGKETGPVARRPLTEIELRLVARITSLFLTELKLAWDNVLELDFEVERVESNPQLVQIVPPNEVVVLISFELTLGDIRGMMNLCIPFNSIERIGNKLTTNNWASYNRTSPTDESIAELSKQLDGALVEMVVTLANSRISTSDLLGLRIGDIITTDKDVKSPLEVDVEGVKKFHASAGAFKGQKAVQIENRFEG